MKRPAKNDRVLAMNPYEMPTYMAGKKSAVSEERSFRNSLALQRTFTEKLTRDKAQAKKERVHRRRLFKNFVQGKKEELAHQQRDLTSFYKQATQDV